MTEYDSDDDMPPELEDMSATIAAARKMRYALRVCAPARRTAQLTAVRCLSLSPCHASAAAPAAEPPHDAGLYTAVVDDATKPEPVVAPLAADTRVKVTGLAKAAQYNGQSGVILGFDREAGRYMVQLKNGKELKIKRENMELVDGVIKGGFLSQVRPTGAQFARGSVPGNARGHTGAGARGAARGINRCCHAEQRHAGGCQGRPRAGAPDRQARRRPGWNEAAQPEARGCPRLDEAQRGPAQKGQRRQGAGKRRAQRQNHQGGRVLVLMHTQRARARARALSLSLTHTHTQAIDEIAKDPQAWLKYKDDPEVTSYMSKMMGLFGQQFDEHEKKEGGSAPAAGGIKVVAEEEEEEEPQEVSQHSPIPLPNHPRAHIPAHGTRSWKHARAHIHARTHALAHAHAHTDARAHAHARTDFHCWGSQIQGTSGG